MKKQYSLSRRRFLQIVSLGLTGLVSPSLLQAGMGGFLTKQIPSSNEYGGIPQVLIPDPQLFY